MAGGTGPRGVIVRRRPPEGTRHAAGPRLNSRAPTQQIDIAHPRLLARGRAELAEPVTQR